MRYLLLISLVLTQLSFTPVAGDSNPPIKPDISKQSPRKSMQEFLQSMYRKDYEKAQRYVEFPRRSSKKTKRANILKVFEVLDQTVQLNVLDLSPAHRGFDNDELPFNREKLFTYKNNGKEEIFYLNKYESPRKDDELKVYWRISRDSVARMLKFDAEDEGVDLEAFVPLYLQDRYFNLAVWQILGVLVFFTFTLFASWIFRKLMIALLNLAFRNFGIKFSLHYIKRFSQPLQLLSFVFLFDHLVVFLRLGFSVRAWFNMAQHVFNLLSALWILFVLIDVFFSIYGKKLQRDSRFSLFAILPLIQRCVHIVVGFLVFIFGLQSLGYNVTALLTGLGVGGIAIALAGQKTIENLLGGFMLLLDQPVKVNDYGQFAGILGTVESIGLRSTRVRTLDRTVVTIPNAEFAQMNIESYACRDSIRFFLVFSVPYETSNDQLRYLISEIKKLLLSHERVLNDPARIRLVSFSDSACKLEIYAYVATTDWNTFLAIREDLLLSVKELLEASGVQFSFPSQKIYWEQNPEQDSQKRHLVESKVQSWRDARKIPIPDFPEDQVAELSNTREFPGVDSWTHR